MHGAYFCAFVPQILLIRQTDGTLKSVVAAITGASSGIGLALAREFARNGYDLLITSEDDAVNAAADELRNLDAKVRPVIADLTTRTGVDRFANAIDEIASRLEVVVINAGIGNTGDFRATDLDQDLEMVDLNCRSVVHLAKRVARTMTRTGGGRIAITSSMASLAPGPFETVYSATKAFDYSFALGLSNELRTGISVTAIMPGPTDTNFLRARTVKAQNSPLARRTTPKLWRVKRSMQSWRARITRSSAP